MLELRPLLVRALRNDGYGALCAGEPRSHIERGTRLSYWLSTALVGGVVSTLSDWTNASNLGWVGLLGSVLVVLTALAHFFDPRRALLTAALAWMACLVAQVAATDHDTFATLGSPFVLTAGAVWVSGQGRLGTLLRLSPLLLPVTLTVLLIPLFTDNMWEAVARLDARNLLFLSFLTIVPLAGLLYGQLARQVGESASSLGHDVLAADPKEAADRVTERLAALVEDEERETVRRNAREPLRVLFASGLDEKVATVSEDLSGALRWRLSIRLLWTLTGLFVAVSLYIYVLACLLVPTAVGEGWSRDVVETTAVDVGIQVLHLPTGVYLLVAGLLGVVATAVLLAFVLTEEHYGDNLADAILRRPLRGGLELALPYAALAEDGSASGGAGKHGTGTSPRKRKGRA